MKRAFLWLSLMGAVAGLAPACLVRERPVARAEGRCRGGAWVDGYYGRRGRWHPGHWRCPGVVERIEID